VDEETCGYTFPVVTRAGQSDNARHRGRRSTCLHARGEWHQIPRLPDLPLREPHCAGGLERFTLSPFDLALGRIRGTDPLLADAPQAIFARAGALAPPPGGL
jgi:hypothetical protein